MKYSAAELSSITGSELIGNGAVIVTEIAFDSRKIYSASEIAFIAIRTTKNSGEKFIRSAIDKGIKIIITEHYISGFEDVTWIITENTVSFLQKLAQHHLGHFPKLITFGITGSNGKTVVKEWLYQCIRQDFSTVKSPKSYNSQIGLPLSILQTDFFHEIGIFEVGISKPGEMQLQENILSPKIGILTHIGTAHSANFESEEQLISEKIHLFKDSEVIIYNGDNQQVSDMISARYADRKLISFGLKSHNDLYIKSELDGGKITTFVAGKDEFSLEIQHRDEATLSNALAVIAVLKFLGKTYDEIKDKINSLRAVEMRLESVVGDRNNLIINDSFTLDLDSLKIALQATLEYQKPHKILLLSDFMEVSNFQQNLYPTVVALINNYGFSEVILVGEDIVKYADQIKSPVTTFKDTKELIDSHILTQFHNTLILLKGARKFEFENIKNNLELQKHDTVLEVNLNAILHNVNVHHSNLSSEIKIMAMVKAYSYGLGSYEIAEFLQLHHIDYLGVAYADEGVELRKSGITVPIIVMNPEQHSYDVIIEYGLEPEIYSFRVLDHFLARLEESGFQNKYPVHIKLETGMHRLGFKAEDIVPLGEKIRDKNLEVKSVFSHLSSSDIPSEIEYTRQQAEIFDKNSGLLMKCLGYRPLRHLLNSSGIANYPEYQYDMVRIGVGMVGISSSPRFRKQLLPAVRFLTVISQVSKLRAGESLGYGRKFQVTEDRMIATIPVGYADGIPRAIGNGVGKVSVKGTLVSIVGNVCMDMMMLDVTGLSVSEGEEVIIFNGAPSLEEFAAYCNTIPYEVLTSISRRVKRIYIKN